MNILMFTNTFTPHVGGVARSAQQFSAEFRRLGHRVLVVAPEFPEPIERETAVVRIPALQQFNGSDFSIAVPIPGFLNGTVREFQPDVVHTHHPFVLGDTALRFAAKYDIPIVFTHHTQYEKYTHYVPGDSPAMQRFAVELAVGYCNLCDAVIAPSETIQTRLQSQGVCVPVWPIPTGVDTLLFGSGDGASARARYGIPKRQFIVGHVGRLAPEKGLEFLAIAVADFIRQHGDACFLVAGAGPSEDVIKAEFARRGVADRLIFTGQLDRAELADAYAVMDVFAFASQSETQGMVLTEAMAAGTPVVAVDAPGVREVLKSMENGILLDKEDRELFVQAMDTVAHLSPQAYLALSRGARQTAQEFSIESTAESAIALYERLIQAGAVRHRDLSPWAVAQRRIHQEWLLWSNVASAFSHSRN
jgi:glycosyltransferase involved in cell wall biosynthesis